ncbi:MAG: GDP-mannose 4,6-dehydratase [Acidimicrobiales bacterium]
MADVQHAELSMKALVTGAAGFVGPHLAHHLQDEGDTFVLIDRGSGPDLLDHQGWLDLFEHERPDVVYHLAGWSDVGASWQNPLTAFDVNARGTLHVLDAARIMNVGRTIVVSSADIYGLVRPDELPLTERSPVRPRSPYGMSKEAAEAVARQAHLGWGQEVVIARPFNHLGAGQGPGFVAPSFAAQIAACERAGGGSLGHGDLSTRRDLTDVRDVVRAYRLLAERGVSGETYNICTGVDVAMSDVLDQLIKQSTVDITTYVDEALIRPIDLPVHRGSAVKLRDATGWTPTFSLRQTLAEVLRDARMQAPET